MSVHISLYRSLIKLLVVVIVKVFFIHSNTHFWVWEHNKIKIEEKNKTTFCQHKSHIDDLEQFSKTDPEQF